MNISKRFTFASILFVWLFSTSPAFSGSFGHRDVCDILQMTIDLPELQEYFHGVDNPDREALKLLVPDHHVNCHSLKKFNKNVVLLKKEEVHNAPFPYIEISQFRIRNHHAELMFKYKIEDISGTAKFEREHGDWRLQESRLLEM